MIKFEADTVDEGIQETSVPIREIGEVLEESWMNEDNEVMETEWTNEEFNMDDDVFHNIESMIVFEEEARIIKCPRWQRLIFR